jgi:hypothetical protein
MPFVEPEDEATPARVETEAEGRRIWRMRLLKESATKAYDPYGDMLIF